MSLLAPREVKDLVYRCCRVAGVDAGTASQCAANVTHAEIHRGDAIAAFVAALSVGASAVETFTKAPGQVQAAEVAASVAVFDPPVVLASISSALLQSAERGYDATGISDTMSAGELIERIEFAARVLSDDRRQAAAERSRSAHAHGLQVEPSLLLVLETRAATYLVAESVIDAAS